MDGIQRWTPAEGDDGAEMWRDSEGDYVIYADHLARVQELEHQLAALSWQPITAKNLPKVGDEILDIEGVFTVGTEEPKWDLLDWKTFGATHFRPINAPKGMQMLDR